MRSNGIVNNTQDGLLGFASFGIKNFNNTGFKNTLKLVIIPFTVVEKMSDGSAMRIACKSEINCFTAVIPKEE